MHNNFILQQYVCYTTILNMFRAARCSSSGGPIVSPQPLAVAYPGIFWGGVQQIQLRTENRNDGDLGAVAP